MKRIIFSDIKNCIQQYQEINIWNWKYLRKRFLINNMELRQNSMRV
jgi:hypothetical protein